MEREFVSYNEALALKELGFKEKCFGAYQKNKKISYCDKNNWITNFQIDPDIETLNLHIKEYSKNVSLIDGIYFLHSCNNFTAPTYQAAFRWFREKYDIEVTVACFYSKRLNIPYEERQYHCHVIRDGVTSKGPKYKTYEEAELACLVKLIEIVKEKL